LRRKGKSETSKIKREIQRVLREIVILRDGGCVLRDIRHCGGTPDNPDTVLQADHLIERSNSATYADPRLVVCVCKRCHGWKHFKKSNHDEYDEIIRSILPPERIRLWDLAREKSWKPAKIDWKLEKVALEQELEGLRELYAR